MIVVFAIVSVSIAALEISTFIFSNKVYLGAGKSYQYRSFVSREYNYSCSKWNAFSCPQYMVELAEPMV